VFAAAITSVGKTDSSSTVVEYLPPHLMAEGSSPAPATGKGVRKWLKTYVRKAIKWSA
jgi:hypothetical protein